jgi:hypothetical protein
MQNGADLDSACGEFVGWHSAPAREKPRRMARRDSNLSRAPIVRLVQWRAVCTSRPGFPVLTAPETGDLWLAAGDKRLVCHATKRSSYSTTLPETPTSTYHNLLFRGRCSSHGRSLRSRVNKLIEGARPLQTTKGSSSPGSKLAGKPTPWPK